MQVIVQKYGGTSVGTLEDIQHVAEHIRYTCLSSSSKVVVVVSAMGSFTDELSHMGLSLNPSPPKREFDMLLSAGERISSSLLSIALDRLGVSSLSLTGSQCGILTDTVHGNARISKILGHRIWSGLEQHQVVIIAGFQGVSPETKDVTTLGRGGSDLTAIALAIALKAKTCEVYKDVPGLLSADPRKIPEAKPIQQLSWDLVSELSFAGAGLVHHRAACLAQKYELPFEIKFTEKPTNPGTLIQGSSMESPQVLAITSKASQTYLQWTFEPKKFANKVLSEGLRWLWSREQVPSVYRLLNFEHKMGIETLIDSDLVNEYLKSQEVFLGKVGGDFLEKNIEITQSLITIVGVGFKQAPEIVEKVLSCFGEVPRVFEVKEHSILLSVAPEREVEYVRKLHSIFFEELSPIDGQNKILNSKRICSVEV